MRETINKFNHKFDNNIIKIISIFLFCQPIIDVATAISIHFFKIDVTVGLIIKFFFLLLMIYYFWFISKSRYKKESISLLIIIGLYLLVFSFFTFYFGNITILITEIKSVFKIFYLPILFIIFFNIYDVKKELISFKKLYYLFLIYIGFIAIPNLLNIGFDSYEITKKGSIGFFYSANEIGAIITILLPFAIKEIIKYQNLFLKIFLFLIITYTFLSLGTKGPLLLYILVLGIYFFLYLKTLIRKKEIKKLSLIGITFVFIILSAIVIIPKTAFYKNIKIHLEFLEVKSITDIITSYKVFDHFIFSERLTFLAEANKNYINSPLKNKLIGVKPHDIIDVKTVEIDLFDIFYQVGIVGFVVYLTPFIYLFKKRIKGVINKTVILSSILAFMLMMLTGHVLVAPSVSILVAIILVFLYNGNGNKEIKGRLK